MSTPREYLVRLPSGADFGRDPDFDACAQRADLLGAGSTVVPLDDYLSPMRDPATGRDVVSYTATADYTT